MAVEVTRNLDKFVRRTAHAIGRVNARTGEQFISDARQTNTYVDKTANLRNSIGYKVTGDEPVAAAGQGEGGVEGMNYANEKSRGIDNGLIMVAGMSYAAPVEAKGYDVITESVKKAKENHKRLMTKMLKI